MTITQLMNQPAGGEFSACVRETDAVNSSIKAGCDVHWLFRASYTDLATGRHGCRNLIVRILSESPDGLTTKQIIARARAIFGHDKYPNGTYECNLSNVLKPAGEIKSEKLAATGRGRPSNLWTLVKLPESR